MLPQGPYNPVESEKEILKFWLDNKFYKPEFDPSVDKVKTVEEMKSDVREAWALICPPPNAYARPHIGNISGYAYQDAMARYARMLGKKVLVLPGKDHAGLEGEGVFVREVLEKQGRNKFDMKREDFYTEMMDFFMKNIDIAAKDEREIGLSADFDRDTFTLDPEIVGTVLDTFVEMYKDGRIYKGVRIINWDPKARTAVADNQCIREERDGKIYYIKYPIVNQKVWRIDFHNPAMFNKIKAGSKKIETRALNPEKNYSDMKVGDTVIFNNKEDNSSLIKKVTKVQIYNKFEDALSTLNWSEVFDTPNVKAEEVINTYNGLKEGYGDKIKQEGLIAFNFEDQDKFITVATTRPETMFGDTAVAVNPKDKRYADLIGKTVIIPLVDIEIPIITNPKVLTDFGTGVLKITPAHAQDDYQIMMEWNAENPDKKIGYRNVVSEDLKLVGTVPAKYKGRKYKEALPEIIEDVKALGQFDHEETIKQNILITERTKAIVEPLMSSQWYLKYDGLKEAAIDMVKKGDVQIHPDNMIQKFNHWMENLRDWAISRSLWWGYRLPVWYHGEIKEDIDENGLVKELINTSSKKDITIRKAKTTDAEAMQNIDVEGWLQNFEDKDRGITKDVIINKYGRKFGDPDKIEEFEKMIDDDNDVFFVAEKDNEVIGWANLDNLKKDDVHWMNVYVSQKAQKQGIGTLLVNHILNEFNNLEIHVATPEKAKLSNFYSKFGFVEYPVEGRVEGDEELYMVQMKRAENTPIVGGSWVTLDTSNEDHIRVQKESPGEGWIQDENVLDTWFSSGQWIYATLTKYNLMDTFFPTTVLVSASDILENWDSRMMMFTYFKHKSIPFKNLFLTGIVLGKDGQKMSKSKGNVLDVDQIKTEYGSDALRMAYFYQNSAGGSYVISPDKLKNFKQFNNKLWNAAKFVMQDFDTANYTGEISDLKLELSKNIVAHVKAIKEKVTKNIDAYEFGYATETLYDEFWHKFCDELIEQSKKHTNPVRDKETNAVISEPNEKEKNEMKNVLIYAIKEYTKMLHPFIPFITEAIWQEMPKTEGDFRSLMYTKW